MICPHCSVVVNLEWRYTPVMQVEEDSMVGTDIAYSVCPSCGEIVIMLRHGAMDQTFEILGIEWAKIVYPTSSRFINSNDIPEKYKEDYEESLKVLAASPKSSAALSRRNLQCILRDEYNITDKNLSEEIRKFSELPGIPSYILDAIDAIRNIGNFAAHPMKDKNTGEIVPVVHGEAEWLIEVIEALFDFTFIQPKKLEKRKLELNLKLERVGKPPMKRN